MSRLTTIFDILVSCPGDVAETCLPIIRNAVDTFNKTFGSINNTSLMMKHWSTDSFPQAGSPPQELLNEQIVRNCDAAVAVFWTRFGTPTVKFGSGTEEEIEQMISTQKQVFLYFLDKAVPPSKVTSDEYKKIQQFKEKFKDKGIYWIVTNENEFQQQLTTHLCLYFLQKIIVKHDNTNLARGDRSWIINQTDQERNVPFRAKTICRMFENSLAALIITTGRNKLSRTIFKLKCSA